MAVNSFMVPLGTPAPDFTLPRADGGGQVALQDLRDAPALLVAFLCNTARRAARGEALGALTAEYADKGLATVGICSTTSRTIRTARPSLVEQAARARFTFPYLVDTDQQV